MPNYICPFCNSSFPLIEGTYSSYRLSFQEWDQRNSTNYSNTLRTNFYKCPTCGKISINLMGINDDLNNLFMSVYPNSLAKQFPDYIPESIREDYNEAYSILYLSPKASATLSRRCLQGMIRDFWKIKKSRLIDEISELQSKVSVSQWKAIDSLRSIGNIGAHMEKDINTIIDVDPNEAEQLLKLIELLIEKWYIARNDEEKLFSSIASIADNKKTQK